MIRVYQSRELMSFPTQDELFQAAGQFFDNEKYVLVAEVATDDLDEAYRLTNTIDKYWCDNDGVTVLSFMHKDRKGHCGNRSTSVGDVMVHNGKVFAVASFGFEQVPFNAQQLKDLMSPKA